MFDTIIHRPDLSKTGKHPANLPRQQWLPSAILLTAMHLAGLAGLNWPPTQPYFLLLVPFNLVATLALVLLAHRDFTRPFFAFCILTFLTGFFAEVVGVQTGLLFGNYTYGETLGWKVFGVPLLLGCNWLTLIYCTGIVADKYVGIKWLKPVAASVLMVLIDILIEPVAMRLDFWSWQHNTVPLQNYAGWFGVSLLLQILFQRLAPRSHNPLAGLAYAVQFAFFMGCNIIHWLTA